MSSIAILGSGFGLYGYLPALITRCGQQVVLPERYRDRFEKRVELAPFAPYVNWAQDELSALTQASGAVLALCPEMQSRWLEACLIQPQLQCLLLEKPLAPNPHEALQWHRRLEQSGKVVRIAYLFRHLPWAEQLRKYISQSPSGHVTISWHFLAHHFRHEITTWKRDHRQGGGAIRFYGIHLIALLAEIGYSNVIESSSGSRAAHEISQWNAVFAGAGLADCAVEIDSASAANRFSIVTDPSRAGALHLDLADPFATSPDSNPPRAIDRRVEVLGRFCQSAWNDQRLVAEFYRPAIDLWQRLEQRIVREPSARRPDPRHIFPATSMTKKTISFISPCYNQEAGIVECYQTIRKLFDTQLSGYNLEYIFCDNASTDRTVALLKEIAAEDKSVKIIVNSRNFGILNNTYNGVLSASGDAILLFMPVDLQDPPELIPEFVKHWESGYEIVYGIRARREENWLLAAARKGYYQLLSRITYLDYPPNVGDFQLIDKCVLAAMKQIDDAQPFMRLMTFECGFRSIGVKYTWRARKHGLSRNSLARMFEQGMTGIISFSSAPIRLALFAGLALSAASMLYAFSVLMLVLFRFAGAQQGIPTMIVALFFFAGVQLFFLGIIGEYVLAIFNQVRRKPLIIERERINFDAGSGMSSRERLNRAA